MIILKQVPFLWISLTCGLVEKRIVKKRRIKRSEKGSYQQSPQLSTISAGFQLVFELRFEEFPVQAGDMADRNMLRAFHFASAGVCAGTESEFVHFGDHRLGAACAFNLALRKQGK